MGLTFRIGVPRVFSSKLSHQIDSELSAIALGTKETEKAIQSLKEMNVKIDRTVLVRDS